MMRKQFKNTDKQKYIKVSFYMLIYNSISNTIITIETYIEYIIKY